MVRWGVDRLVGRSGPFENASKRMLRSRCVWRTLLLLLLLLSVAKRPSGA